MAMELAQCIHAELAQKTSMWRRGNQQSPSSIRRQDIHTGHGIHPSNHREDGLRSD
jgi:hypothetical protein